MVWEVLFHNLRIKDLTNSWKEKKQRQWHTTKVSSISILVIYRISMKIGGCGGAVGDGGCDGLCFRELWMGWLCCVRPWAVEPCQLTPHHPQPWAWTQAHPSSWWSGWWGWWGRLLWRAHFEKVPKYYQLTVIIFELQLEQMLSLITSSSSKVFNSLIL